MSNNKTAKEAFEILSKKLNGEIQELEKALSAFSGRYKMADQTPSQKAAPLIGEKEKAPKIPARPVGHSLDPSENPMFAPSGKKQQLKAVSQFTGMPGTGKSGTQSVPRKSVGIFKHGDYHITKDKDGTHHLFYARKPQGLLGRAKAAFGLASAPEHLGSFGHGIHAYDAMLAHSDEVQAGLRKEEEEMAEKSDSSKE